MTSKKVIDLSKIEYTSLQGVIESAENDCLVILEAKVYSESLVIHKPIQIRGQRATVLQLNKHQIVVESPETVVFESLNIQIIPHKEDANIVLLKSDVVFENCELSATKENRGLYSCIWAENCRVSFLDSKVDLKSNFIKVMNGDYFMIRKCEMLLKGGTIAVEAHGMSRILLENNHIISKANFMRCTKSVNIEFESNTIEVNQISGMQKPILLEIDGLEHGETCLLNKNIFKVEKEMSINVSNSLSINRKIIFSGNEIIASEQAFSELNFDHLQGILIIENNQLKQSKVSINRCSELLLKQNEIQLLTSKQVNLLMLLDNRFLEHIVIDTSKRVNFKKNSIINERGDCEAIRMNAVDKLFFEKNKISSVDHGLTLLNAGDNLEIMIQKNEFYSCRKRGINIASTVQKKYLKTEVFIQNNLFTRNEKAIYLDDDNLKSCEVKENYFTENKEAITILGGKSTSTIKVYGNYFDASCQRIEMRSAQACRVSHNNFSDSRLNIRGCDEILINGNCFDRDFSQTGKSHHNEVSIKSGGSLTVSQNWMLNGKPRHEKKEVQDFLNVTSYERSPALNISDNLSLRNPDRRSTFDIGRQTAGFPDESILSAIKYQINSEQGYTELKIDDVLKNDFFKLRDGLLELKNSVASGEIRQLITAILDPFDIEIFAGRETNDIYRLIVKSNETLEMLKLYADLEEETDLVTQERIKSVLNNYLVVFNQFLNQQTENEQDKLMAQLKLLENLL